MSKPKTKLPEQALEKMIRNLQVGISKIESGKDGYTALNTDNDDPDLQALGKYQFVPKYWWKDIKAFAKKNGYNDMNDYQDFLRSPSLQDSYFRYNMKTHVIPQAQAIYETGKNPDKLTLEEMAAFYHFQAPDVAKKAITMGEEGYRKATKKGKKGATVSNISMKAYRNKYNEALKEVGFEPTTAAEIMEPKTKEEIAKDYFTKKDKVIFNSTDLSKEEKNKRIQEINTQLKADGHVDIVNEYIEQRNEELKKEHQSIDPQKKENLKQLLKFAESAKIQTGKDKKGNPIISKNATIPMNSSKDVNAFKQWADSNGIKYNELSNNEFEIPGFKKILQNQFKEVTGKTLDVKTKSTDPSDLDVSMGNIASKVFGGNKLMPGKFDIENVDSVIDNAGSLTQLQKLDSQYIPDPVKIPKSVKKSTDKKTEETEETEEEKTVTPEADGQTIGAAQEAFNTELGLLSVGDGKTVPLEGKRELPIDAITGMALGLIGNEQARNANIPLRTEEVSQAVKQFTADLAKTSKEGLPAEVEAAMNNKLAEAYQGGLRSIVNASAGNRATVLGNQGQLEVAKNRGLVDISLADFEAKEKAFQQYGEAIKYKNDFDARRDIANHSIRYQEGKRDQRLGTELATAGFKQLVDGIKYQKENGPGSANSLYKAHLFQKMFGFNPNAPDDGTGKPGTKSAWEMKKKKKEQEKTTVELYQSKLNSMNPNQRKAADKFFESNIDSRSRYEFLDHLEQNPNIDPETIKMENMDLATKEKDYGLLSVDRKELEKPKTISAPVINKTEDFFAEPQAPVNASNDVQGLLATAPKPNHPEQLVNDKEKAPNFAEDYESRVLENLTNLV